MHTDQLKLCFYKGCRALAGKNLHLSASVRQIQTSLQQDWGLLGNIWQC